MIFPTACKTCAKVIQTEREFEEHECSGMHVGIEHTEKSILSEHYGLNESLLESGFYGVPMTTILQDIPFKVVEGELDTLYEYNRQDVINTQKIINAKKDIIEGFICNECGADFDYKYQLVFHKCENNQIIFESGSFKGEMQ